MKQVVSVLTIGTGLSIQIAKFHSQSRRGRIMGETNIIPVQELWLKRGGLMHKRGRVGGILWYIHVSCHMCGYVATYLTFKVI